MALIYCDGFDHYTSAGTKGWAVGPGTNSGGTTGAYGRFGGGWRQSDPRCGIYRPVPTHTSGVIGVAVRPQNTLWASGIITVVNGANRHLTLWQNTSGQLTVYLSDLSSVVCGPSRINCLRVGVWSYIEIAYIISSTSGSVTVRVDAVEEISATGVVTQVGSSSDVNGIGIGSSSSGGGGGYGSDFDDLYVLDTSGTYASFIGDIRVETLFPNGNGNSSQFVGSDSNSTDNYALVDETPQSTADYVESSTAGDKDTYTFSDLVTTAGTVYGVQTTIYAAKTDAGTRKLAMVSRLSGTEVDSADMIMSTSATSYSQAYETKPGGGTWSISDVNSAEFGVKVIA